MSYLSKERRFLLWSHAAALLVHTISTAFAWDITNRFEQTSDLVVPMFSFQNANSVVTSDSLFQSRAISWIALNETITALAHVAALIIIGLNSKQADMYESIRRWGSYAITAGLLECAIVIALGNTQFFGIVFLLVANVILQSFGYLIDWEVTPSKRAFYFIAGLLLFLAEAIYVGVLASNTTGLADTLPVNFKSLGVLYGLFYASFGICQLFRQLRGGACVKVANPRRCCGTLQPDGVFVLLSITSKIVLSWSLIGIILTGYKNLGVNTPWPETNFEAAQYGILIASGVVFVLGLVLNHYFSGNDEYVEVNQTDTTDTTEHHVHEIDYHRRAMGSAIGEIPLKRKIRF